MKKHSKEELIQAETALASMLGKCEKIMHSGRLADAQETLLDRRVQALHIALALIKQALEAQADS